MNTRLCFVLFFAFLAGCAGQSPSSTESATRAPLPSSVEEAVHQGRRTEANRARDQYRHPIESLNFFGLKPDMTVVEISPGAGWYMEILAPILSEHGKYYGAIPPSTATGEASHNNEKINNWLKSNPDVKAILTEFSPPDKLAIAPDDSADMVLTFRNVHNWIRSHSEQAVFNAFFKALKPGGILGVVEHRENPKLKQNPDGKTGYVREDYVIKLAKKAGFKLVAKSEINANPKDTKDYPDGVWTLPPTFALKDKDHDKYAAIGESDRMTLKFIKPAPNKRKHK